MSIGNEFYMTFSKEGSGCAVDRLTLARRALTEHAEIARTFAPDA